MKRAEYIFAYVGVYSNNYDNFFCEITYDSPAYHVYNKTNGTVVDNEYITMSVSGGQHTYTVHKDCEMLLAGTAIPTQLNAGDVITKGWNAGYQCFLFREE